MTISSLPIALLSLALAPLLSGVIAPQVAGWSIIAPAAIHAQVPTGNGFASALAYAEASATQALLVLHRGRVVHEVYMNGGSARHRQLLASGSKSFVGVATLAAVQDGVLQLDQRVATVLPEWAGEPRKARVTVRQLLSLESGLSPGVAATGCGGPGKGWSDAVATPAVAEPGTVFAYGPYPFIIMGAVIERANPRESFAAYLDRRIMQPLGVTVAWRAHCGDGKPQLAGGAAMTARDWATFGEFVRRGGMHDQRRLLDSTLVAQLFVPSAANSSYGLSWWLGEAAEERAPTRPSRAARGRRSRVHGASVAVPHDLVMAAGAGKQRLYIIPSRELVVVRLGPLREGRTFNDQEFLQRLLDTPDR